MGLKAAFIFVAPEAEAAKHRAQVDTPAVQLTVVGVKDYNQAVQAAEQLASEGVTVIELCAGFGNGGAAIVQKAVKGRAIVGVVRFDNHPGLDFQSGDDLFGNK